MKDCRLVYVRGHFAWFVERPEEATGDDWNDAPHDCNAGEPYKDRGGEHVKVAWDGGLEVAGSQCGVYSSGETPYGLSVDEINRGDAPWLYQPSYGHEQYPKPLLEIPALCTLSEFRRLVARATGRVYVAVSSPSEALKENPA